MKIKQSVLTYRKALRIVLKHLLTPLSLIVVQLLALMLMAIL